MNIILFEQDEELSFLSWSDERARHVRDVLRMDEGDAFFVGRVNGPRGKAHIVRAEAEGMALEVEWEERIQPLRPAALLVGLPRPQTARRILFEAASLGASSIQFFNTDRGEPSYADSTLWSSGEWRRHVRNGVEQAFHTLLPEVHWGVPLEEALQRVRTDRPDWPPVALDVYEGTELLPRALPAKAQGVVLLVGAERGWSPAERDWLRANGVALAHLGDRVLRTETACAVGLGLCLGRV